MVPRIPVALKQLRGTLQASKEAPNAPQVNLSPVGVPVYITTSARTEEIYYQLVRHLQRMRVLSKEDESALAILATTLNEIEELTAMIESEGRVYRVTTQSGDVMWRARPEVGMRADALRRARTMLNEFGLTPAARAKVTVAGEKEDNPFASLTK